MAEKSRDPAPRPDVPPLHGVPTTAEPPAPPAPRHPTCPTCGERLAVYTGSAPHKRGTGHCARCGARHPIG